MAGIDAQLLLSEDLAFEAGATTAYSTNEIDFGAGLDAFGAALANPNVGQGNPMYLNIVIPVTCVATAGSPTVTFNLVGGTATAPTTVIQQLAPAIGVATLVAGYKLSFPLRAAPAIPRFVRLQVVTGVNGMSAGTYTAWVSDCTVADA